MTQMMERDIYCSFVQRRSLLIGCLSCSVGDQENSTTNTADLNASNDTGGEFHQRFLLELLSDALFSASSEPMAIEQMKQLFTDLQKRHDENFKNLNRKLEMKLGSGKVRSYGAHLIILLRHSLLPFSSISITTEILRILQHLLPS